MKSRTPIVRKKLGQGILGEANLDGSVYIDKSVKPGSALEKRVLSHEGKHAEQMKLGILAYSDNDVTYKGVKYPRKDGKIKYNGQWHEEGSNVFPWEQDAVNNEERLDLSNFDHSVFKSMKPKGDNTFDTMQEIKELTRIHLNPKFVKDYDDIELAFKRAAKNAHVPNYDPSIAADLIQQSAPIILDIKNHFNRPRPKVMAAKMNIPMQDLEMASMKTPSYPSGHSVQGILIAKVLADHYPMAAAAFIKTGDNISYSRRVARAHYKSDSKLGEYIGKEMYKHIKNKT